MQSNFIFNNFAGPQLMEACRSGNLGIVQSLLDAGTDVTYSNPEDGVTPLMIAAEGGHIPLMTLLLEAGAPWNAQDKDGHTAGEYATGSGNREAMPVLLDWAVTAELLLSSILDNNNDNDNKNKEGKKSSESEGYLGQKLRYVDGVLLDADNEAVMMGWEAPLMVHHADIICGNTAGSGSGCGDVLNVGFGLGIIDTEIQKRNPRSHTIIEAHPDVHARMLELGWDKKPGVKILFGRWQDVVSQLEDHSLDGIFWDTYAEYYEDMRIWHQELPRLLRPNGVYSFFNGLAPDNLFFHLVYGEIARRELNALGFSVKYDAVPIDASSDEIWDGVANRYWNFSVYFVPTCVLIREKKETAVVEEKENGGMEEDVVVTE
jgi:type IV protein arginine methyltransferase